MKKYENVIFHILELHSALTEQGPENKMVQLGCENHLIN